MQIDKIDVLKDGIWTPNQSTNNNIKFAENERTFRVYFSTASLNNRTNIKTRYRLFPVDKDWITTGNSYTEYHRLPGGKYSFQLQFQDSEGRWLNASSSLVIQIDKYYYETWWFNSAVVIIAVLTIVLATSYVVRKRKQRQLQYVKQQQQINELQLQAIRSKAVPHFTANAFANIDYYIETGDKENASKYLALLSRLYNITLLDAEKPARTLEDELAYVLLYLQLEKMRFDDKLEYTIDVEPGTDKQTFVPNMAIHTYAENAVKHGLRNKAGKGTVFIKCYNKDNGVMVEVQDDGIGRKATELLNINSTGQGLKILRQQVQLYNKRNKLKIKEEVKDLSNDEGDATGTFFSLWVPKDYNY